MLEDYIRLFPDRLILPLVRSINSQMDTASSLRYILRSLTPTENQPSTSASTLRSLSIYRSEYYTPQEHEGEDLARYLAAFQHSNSKLGGGLESFQDFLPFPERGRYHYFPAGCNFQESIENAFALPSPETTGALVHGLRRLEVTHHLRELPAFFERVGRMRALEHLKIAIAYDHNIEETGAEASVANIIPKSSHKDQTSGDEAITHSASSLEIEGRWGELSLVIHLCALPSKVTRFRTLRLFYYLPTFFWTPAQGVRLLDLPANIIPPDSLDTLSVNLLDHRDEEPNVVPNGIGAELTVDAFRPLLRYKQMVELHLELPYNILLDLNFLRALAAEMGKTSRHLVVLRRLEQWVEDDFKPVLTANDLSTIVGVIMPRLEVLGLDASYDEIPAPAKRNSPVASSLRDCKPGKDSFRNLATSGIWAVMSVMVPTWSVCTIMKESGKTKDRGHAL